MVGSKLCYLKLLWENGGELGRRERKTFYSKFCTGPFIPDVNLTIPSHYIVLIACRLDGTCRHIAAVLFDLEHTACINDVKSCTSGQCQWVRRAKPNTNSCSLQE